MMKKTLLSLLMVAVFMPLAMAQNNNPLVIVNNNVTACETYTWSINNTTYTNSTVATYLDTTGDTLHVLNLTVNHIYNNTEALISNLCAYTWRGNTYYHSGTYSDTVLANSSLGTCDSFFTVTLTIPTSEVINQTVNACGSYVWNDSTYTETGIYSVSSQIVNPDLSTCTHIDQLTLNIVNTLNVDETVEQCGHYTWYGETYDQTGVYTHVESDTTIGCDTIHTLNLTVVVNTAEPLSDSACSYYIWRGDTITTSGLYTINDTNASTGCVTIRSINLNIKPFRTPVRDTTMVGCNGISFTVSSLAGSTIKRFSVDTTFDTNLIDRRWARCYDSTIHLNVIVHKSGYDTTYANACDSFYWKLNKKTYYKTPTTNPTYAFASDQYNCDSIMVLVLNVKTSPVITAINGEWNLNAGDTAVLYPTCTEGASYKWTYGTHTFTGDTLRIPDVQGNIDVALEATLNYPANNLACHDTSWITLVTFVGIDQAQATNVSLYPNPTVGQLNIESAEAIREVAIFNTLGQQVVTNYNLGNKSLMNLSNLSKGTYSMRITLQNGETVVRKFVITK